MQNQKGQFSADQQSIFYCIGQISEDKMQDKEGNKMVEQIQFKKDQTHSPSQKDTHSNHFQADSKSSVQQRIKDPKRRRSSNQSQVTQPLNGHSQPKQSLIVMQYIQQRQHQQQRPKDQKQSKQGLYSKNYRQRKKQSHKILEEENSFLKKKIQDLHARLREMQLELSRLKYAPPEKQFSVQELNAEFVKVVKFQIDDINSTDPKQKERSLYQEKMKKAFMTLFQIHGFGGSKKRECLNYYFNQILEGALKDSERYLMIALSKIQDQQHLTFLPKFQPINSAFYNFLEGFSQDKKEKIEHFLISLRPGLMEYKQICSKLWINFQRLLNNADKIHKTLKETYMDGNMEWVQNRINLEKWFEQHKYDKFMRRLRGQWLQQMKQLARIEEQQEKKKEAKSKKKTNKI